MSEHRHVLDCWAVVRDAAINRLREEVKVAYEPSIWHADSMDDGDVSEFPAMMRNLERLLGVEEGFDWSAAVRNIEAEAAAYRERRNDE